MFFPFNNFDIGCKTACGREHVCQICFARHPWPECPVVKEAWQKMETSPPALPPKGRGKGEVEPVKGIQPLCDPACLVVVSGGLSPGVEGNCAKVTPSHPALESIALPSNEARVKDLKRKLQASKARFDPPKASLAIPSMGKPFIVHKAVRKLGHIVCQMIKEAIPEERE